MYRVKIKDAVNEEAGVFPQEYIGSCIDVVRDGGVIFYVGQSEDPLFRLQQHLGLERRLPSSLGRLILRNQPESDEWMIECYRLSDCQPLVEQSVAHILDEKQRALLIKVAGIHVTTAGKCVIRVLSPCL